jgi:O-antigen ligase/tetratricopeptide (TPR) repeat protein
MKDVLQGIVFVGLFLIPFLPVYVANDFFFPFITGKNFAFRIIVEIVFASWALLALYDAQYRPRFSWILAGFLSFLGVMAVANALGEYPLQSFWSNFERMDGYVTLLHVFLFVVVAGSVFTTQKLWSYFFHVSCTVAFLVALHGLGQYFGVIVGPESSKIRIDSRLGNSAYMAIYMLFHIFMLFWLLVNSKNTLHKALYLGVSAILIITLLLTGTRGTFLGFIGGGSIMVGYIALFARAYPEIRKIAIGACVVVLLLGAGFFVAKDSAYVQNSAPLSRIANIDLAKDLSTRSVIWKMALEGAKERPLLGWGQSNFNYVFNKEYEPSLYAGESWFDRTHNIVLDWLIAGGVLGLLTYFSIFFAALYYLVFQPHFSKKEPVFNVLERGVLIGLLVGYLLHNVVVFDNIISYIFYGTILACIHSRVSTHMKSVESFKLDERLISQFVAPLVVILMFGTVYFVNAPGIGAAGDVIDAMTAPTVKGRLEEFNSALSRHSFADQEIIEQLAQQAMSIVRNPQVSKEEKDAIVMRAELELLRLIEEKPGDARLHSFLSSFYRSIGALPQAQEQAAKARELSPNKQAIILEQGIIEIQVGNVDRAAEYFKTAFELDERNTQARVLYASILVSQKKIEDARELLGTEYFKAFAVNDFALSMVDQSKDRDLLAEMFEIRITEKPEDPQNRASLAFIYYEQGQIGKAIEVLEKASGDLPEFTKSAQCFITNLKKGEKPDVGC